MVDGPSSLGSPLQQIQSSRSSIHHSPTPQTQTPPSTGPRKKRGQRGLALIETFVFVGLMGMALLWHAASSLSGYNLMRAESSHGAALQTVRHFMERLRTDPDWETLYGRLSAQADVAGPPEGYLPQVYYSDFQPPNALGQVRIQVEVPRAAPVGSLPTDPLVLREDITAVRFGLPHDLNGDGTVDSLDHENDYRGLPVIVHFNWTAPGESPQSLRVSTYLRGLR